MAQINQRLALQIVAGLLATIPIFLGLNGMHRGLEISGEADSYPVLMDSHFRYLSGIFFAMGVLLLRSLPTIDQDGSDLHRISLLVFIGGLGRLWGLITVAFSFKATIALVMELFVTPAVCLWQYQIQQNTIPPRTK